MCDPHYKANQTRYGSALSTPSPLPTLFSFSSSCPRSYDTDSIRTRPIKNWHYNNSIRKKNIFLSLNSIRVRRPIPTYPRPVGIHKNRAGIFEPSRHEVPGGLGHIRPDRSYPSGSCGWSNTSEAGKNKVSGKANINKRWPDTSLQSVGSNRTGLIAPTFDNSKINAKFLFDLNAFYLTATIRIQYWEYDVEEKSIYW